MKTKRQIVIMKFGGSSVGNVDKIRSVAERVIRAKDNGKDVVVVVSAMGDTTDNLISLAGKISDVPNKREMDMLLSTGEQVSIALLAMAVQAKGNECVSLTGNQAGIFTDEVYSNAKITHINNARLLKELKNGKIIIVAGFQGITADGDISTLGRGGSDTTAVALAAALNAEYCEIFTDVDGVYTADPNIVPEARKIEKLSYEEMLETASSGAKVLHLRAVEFAKNHNVVLSVRSSFNENKGTWVMDDSKKIERMERPVVTGVTYDTNQVKITIFGLADKPGIAAISFTVKNEDLNEAKKVIESLKKGLDFTEADIDPNVAKVSLVGAGMQTHAGVAAKMFEILAKENINIEMISTSPIRISCVIRKEKVKTAVKVLHSGFGLDKERGL